MKRKTKKEDLQVLTELKETLDKLLQALGQVETTETEEIKPLTSLFLKELMNAIMEQRWDEVERMRDELETFLEKGLAKDRKLFALDLYDLLKDLANELRIFRRLKTTILKLLEKRFAEYYEWIEELKDKADRLSEDINKLYDEFDCD